MGYYVEVIAGEVIIPKRNLTKAYKAMCELNKKHDLKFGSNGYERCPAKDERTMGCQLQWVI